MNTAVREKKAWYREPIAWLAFAPAIAGVVFGLSLLVIGSYSYDGTVHENYYKEGRAINQSFARDEVARGLGLSADLRFTQDELQMSLSGDLSAYPEQLVVLMEHPTRSNRDFSIAMEHLQGGRYLGRLPQKPENNWDIKLYGPERQWRLYARASFPVTQSVILRPSQR